jgi:ankyrin repeat protein
MENGHPTPISLLRGRPRLHELAPAFSVPLSISSQSLLSSQCPIYVTSADRERANALLAERRTVDPEYKAPKVVSKLFKKKGEVEPFSQKEINRALAAVVAEGISPGLADALLEFGGDVNVARKASKSTWKKITRSDQQDRRSDLLPKAVQGGNVEITRLLASRADQLSLDDALPSAIENGQLDITRILLEYGADPAEFHEQFLFKISEGREDMTGLLMQGPKRPCLECRAKGLLKAVEKGSLQNTTVLMLNGADADYEQASAFQLAVKNGRNDLAIALAIGQKPPSPSSLDMAVSTAYTSPGHDLEKKTALIEICLCGGAKGDHTAKTLLKAVEEKQAELVDLLLAYEASVNYEGGSVIKHVILDGQNELMLKLLQKSPSPISLSNAVDSAMTLNDLSVMYDVIKELLNAGASGDAINQALITAVKLAPDPHAYKITQLLLDRGRADINFQEGKALQLMAASGTVDVLRLLLASESTVVSVNAAFPFAMEIQDASTRLVVVEMLLQTGANGVVVDQALVTAAKIGAEGIPLATLLLRKASVDFENGKALCEAIRIRCFELVCTLVTVKPSLETLTAAWAEATLVSDDELQFKLFHTLLELGMKGDPVGHSLVVATTKKTQALEFCKLLVKYGASVDYGNGEAMIVAVQHSYINILELLLSANPSKASLTPTLAAAQALREEERLAAVSPILKVGVAQEVCDAGLLQAVQEQPSDSRLVQLFLDANASPDFSNGSSVLHAAGKLDVALLKMLACSINSKEVVSNAFGVVFQSGDKRWRSTEGLAFVELLIGKGAAGEHVNNAAVQAARMFDIDALELIAQPVSPASVFTTAFTEATRTRDDWISPEGLTVVQFLLEKGASGSDVHATLNKAASTFNFEALQLLSTVVVNPEAYTIALGEALGAGEEWLLPRNQEVIELLLEHSASGETLHVGLLQALDAYIGGTASESLIDLLLHYKADVNYNNGEALQQAASSGDDAMLKKLLSYGATQESISLAFSIAIASQHEEKRLFALLDTFVQNPVKPDVNFVYPDIDPPLILSLQLYPESAAIAKRMCDLGCNIEKEVTCEIYDDEMQESELVTPLLWALLQPDNMINTDVIAALLESNGKCSTFGEISPVVLLYIPQFPLYFRLFSNDFIG